MEIKYTMKDGYVAIPIYNDMSVRLYMEMKKKNLDITEYPLCITLKTVYSSAECSYSSSYLGGNLLATTSAGNLLATTSVGLQCQNIEEVHGTNIVEMMDNHVKEDKIEILKGNCIIDNPQYEEIAEDLYCLTCVDKSCKWSLRSSSLRKSNVFKVRRFNDVHTCPEMSRLFSQRHATSSAIAKMICNKYTNPKIIYTPTDIMSDMKQQYGINMSYIKAYRTKEKALELLRGIPRESYRKLPGHLYMINMTNPGFVTRLHKSEDGRFMYVFIALNASIIGWKYCYPIVVVDGTFLKSSHRGIMLTASVQDAADSENDASWEWFFEMFRQAFGERERMCIVLDRHASILRGASIVYPEVSHCVCIFHLWNNIKKQFKKNRDWLREVFFAMARAYKIEDFNRLMEDMDNIDKRVRGYLFQVGYKKWSIVHSTVNRSMVMTSNIAESLNARNREARELPIMSLLVYMMNLVMEWNNTNRMAAMSTFIDIGQKYHEVLKENSYLSQKMTVKPSTDYVYVVMDAEQRRNIVCMQKRECSCKRFQVDEIPCPHAMAVLDYTHMEAPKYCSAYYTKEYFKKTYEVPVNLLPDETTWDLPTEVLDNVVLPPIVKGKLGKPTKSRRKGLYEYLYTESVTCGLCGKQGHNRRTCRNAQDN
ncbi:uncharacterized protein LOC142176365 [Nicotiana tabacum]|uniref:Uncharacterized protein LOC142176365 n=1 Tax=Nicotiana tabacum TaxID=4097 RepID=A0AC58TRH4_TOBAC